MRKLIHAIASLLFVAPPATAADRTVEIGTDVAGFLIFHPDDLAHRAADPIAWYAYSFAYRKESAAGRLVGETPSFAPPDESAAVTLAGVDVASFGDALARTPDAVDVLYADPVAGVAPAPKFPTTKNKKAAGANRRPVIEPET